jgi:hypothetical protein
MVSQSHASDLPSPGEGTMPKQLGQTEGTNVPDERFATLTAGGQIIKPKPPRSRKIPQK